MYVTTHVRIKDFKIKKKYPPKKTQNKQTNKKQKSNKTKQKNKKTKNKAIAKGDLQYTLSEFSPVKTKTKGRERIFKCQVKKRSWATCFLFVCVC